MKLFKSTHIRVLLFVVLTVSIVFSTAANGDSEKEKKNKEKAQKIVDEVNAKSNGWKAAMNKFSAMDDDVKKRMLGTKFENEAAIPDGGEQEVGEAEEHHQPTNASSRAIRAKRQVTCTFSSVFDARTQWPGCAGIIGNIRDQSNCGSCWAVASGSVMSDRMCIVRAKRGVASSPTASSSYASEADILSCSPGSSGCNGGYPSKAFAWMTTSGVVTGTNYTTKTGCKPYPFPPHATTAYTAPACSASCKSGYPVGYAADKKFVKDPVNLYGTNETSIINALRANGSVVASMLVYDDFYYYSSGIYKYTYGAYVGGHAVRIVGYGTRTCTDGTSQKYWTVANSWNTNWGLKGFFRIARGTNQVGIEGRGIYFATPKV